MMTINEDRLDELIETATTDIGAIAYAPLATIGDRLGLYDTIAEHGPLTPRELADRTDTAERYVREWLAASAASDYVSYDPETERYSLSPEQAYLLADTEGPASPLAGLFQLVVAAGKAAPEIERAFRTGEGVGWHEHDAELFDGMKRASENDFKESLVPDWIPALDGVDEKLQEGARVADIGCGYGESTITMVRAYPQSTFVGYDYHEASIEAARERAAAAGVADRVRFEVAKAKEYDGGEYDLVTFFDCLHDMGDPVGVAEHVRETLADDGTWMIVELLAGDRVEENLLPRGRMFYSLSTMLCTPNALDQDGTHALGTQAGEGRLREVVTKGGFTEFRRATETPPFKMVLEAKP
jgi:2-polyprenyl-3-methyl-5-hydroxy-6-metoxy-1,4-benzoquinol methylase